MEKKRKKKKMGRPRTGVRPIISTRVHLPLYNEIRQSAAAYKLTISEETEKRLELSTRWPGAEHMIRKLLAENQALIARGKEPQLRKLAGLIAEAVKEIAKYEADP